MLNQRFKLDTEIIFGLDCILQLPKEGKKFGEKVLLVTGKNSLKANGILDHTLTILQDEGIHVSVYAEVEPEPSLNIVKKGLDLARSDSVNWVIGIGGGSAMDVAKAIAGLFNLPGSVEEYFAGAVIDQAGLPLVTVPTTSGSGAEVTVNAVLSDPGTMTKQSIRSPLLAAKLTILDPRLTFSNTPQTTAYSGFDALVQAIEAYTSTGANPFTDIYAYTAIEKIGANLLTAYRDGQNEIARTEMAVGSLMAGVALTNARLGAVHGMAHSIGIRTGNPHGLVCAVLLVPVMRFNMAVSYPKYAMLAKALGHNTAGMDPIDAAAQGIKTIMSIQKKLGIPIPIRSLGITEADFPIIAEESLPSGSLKANPREVKYENIINILKENY